MQKIGEVLIVVGIVAIPLLAFSVAAILLMIENVIFWGLQQD